MIAPDKIAQLGYTLYENREQVPLHHMLLNRYHTYPMLVKEVGDKTIIVTVESSMSMSRAKVFVGPKFNPDIGDTSLFTKQCTHKIRTVSIYIDEDTQTLAFYRWLMKTERRVLGEVAPPKKLKMVLDTIDELNKHYHSIQLAYVHATAGIGLTQPAIKVRSVNSGEFKLIIYGGIIVQIKHNGVAFRIHKAKLSYRWPMVDNDTPDYSKAVQAVAELAEHYQIFELNMSKWLYYSKGKVALTLALDLHPMEMSDLLGELKKCKFVKRIIMAFMEKIGK